MSKRLLIFSLLLVLAAAAGWYWFASGKLAGASASGPIIQIRPTEYDWGTVIYGQVARQTFQITNNGDQPLEIQRLSTSCGCTQAFMAESDKIIAPGASADLLVTFDPAVHEDHTYFC